MWNTEDRQDIKHGHSYSVEYRAWISIKGRCLDSKHLSFGHYGGRGITICDAWQNDFLAFYHHVGPRPSNQHSIDRYPDNDGNYEPGNVRWATDVEQAANRRNTAWVIVRGKKITMSNACRRFNLNYNAVRMRMRRGATPEEAIVLVKKVPQRKRRT